MTDSVGVRNRPSYPSLLGWERARERTEFPMGTPESSHPPSLSHTSKYTTHNPMVTSQVTSQAQEETPLTKVQPAPQCPGRPFRGRGLAGRPRAPCAARETAPGAAATYSPAPHLNPRRGPKLPWPETTGPAAPVWGASPETSIADSTSSPSASLQNSWPPSALGNPSCPVDTKAPAPGSPLGTKQPRPPSPATARAGRAWDLPTPISRWHPLQQHCGEQQLLLRGEGQDCPPPSPANLQGTLG